MIIYLVEQGEYSDYGVLGGFSTRELAQQYCDNINMTDGYYKPAEVVEMVIDEEVKTKFVDLFEISIELDTGKMFDEKTLKSQYEENYRAKWAFVSRGCFYSDKSDYVAVKSTVSMDHAKKVACERRQWWLVYKHFNNNVGYWNEYTKEV